MMAHTPRVFVGAATLLIAGTSDDAPETVIVALNDFPGVRVVAADRSPGWSRSAPNGR